MESLNRSGVGLAAAETPNLSQLLNVVSAAVIVGALYLGRSFLVPVTLAVLLAFVLAPLVRFLRRRRIPRVAAVLATAILSLLAVTGGGALIGAQVAGLAQDLPTYQGTIHSKIEQVSGMTTSRLSEITARLGLQVARTGREAARETGLGKQLARPAGPDPVLVEVYRPPPTAIEIGRKVLRPVLTPLATLGLVFVLAVFILLQQTDLRDRLIRLMGAADLHRTTAAMNDAATRLSRYFLTQLGVNAAFGGLIAAGLTAIGVPHGLLWGAVAGLLRFVPYLGGLVSTSLAVAMAAAADPGWGPAVWTVLLFLGVETVTGQVVEPTLYGHSTGLSPVSVVVAAVFWTWLWGPVGLILSTPLSLCLVVLGRHVPRLAFIDVLLGDSAPLTQVESFYQRILADDGAEILEQAEGFLVQGSVADYYDDIAMKGLLLAAFDAHRGILKRDRLAAIVALVENLISELGLVTEADAAKPLAGGKFVCIAGPGLLDEPAARLLADLLHRGGALATFIPYRSAASHGVASDGRDALCIVHLTAGVSATRLARLMRRLADDAPKTQIILAQSGTRETPAVGTTVLPGVLEVENLRMCVDQCLARTQAAAAKGHRTPRTRKGAPRSSRARLSSAAQLSGR